MKRTFLILVVVGTMIFSAQIVRAQEAASTPQAGVVTATNPQNLPDFGLIFSKPGESDSKVTQVSAREAAPVSDEPKAKRKEEGKAVKKKESKKEKKAAEASEKDQAKAIQAAMEGAIKSQVETLIEERQKEMPYLDRMYIRTSITPLKVQRTENFLQSGPKDLAQLIQRAQQVHSQTKAADEGINLYHRRVLYALRKLFPELSFDFNNRKGSLSGDGFLGQDWRMTLRQPIFNGGVLWNTLLQEKASLEAARKQYDKVVSDLIFDVSRAYFEYQRALQTVRENKSAVKAMERYDEMSQKKFEQNIISEIENLNVESLYSQMQFDLETAKQEFEIAKLDLQRYLDLSVNDSIHLQRTYDLSGLLEKNPETQEIVSGKAEDLENVAEFLGDEKAPELPKLIDMSYGHRPELMVEAAKLQATRLGERIRWGDFLPKAYLTYEAGQLGEAYLDQSDRVVGIGYVNRPVLKKEWRLFLELNWNVGGNKVSYTFDRDSKAPSISQFLQGRGTTMTKNNIKFGVLDGLDAYINVKQAEVDKLNQVVELEKAEKQVLQDVKQAFYDYQKSLIQVRSSAKRAKWRERLLELAKHRLERNEVEISEFMQAESDLVRERGDLHSALNDYYSAKAALNHAIGIQGYLGVESDYGSR